MAILGSSPIGWSNLITHRPALVPERQPGALMLRAPGPRMTLSLLFGERNPEFFGGRNVMLEYRFQVFLGLLWNQHDDISNRPPRKYTTYMWSLKFQDLWHSGNAWKCNSTKPKQAPLCDNFFGCPRTCSDANSWSNLGKVIINDVSVLPVKSGLVKTASKKVCSFGRSQTVCAKRIPNVWEFLDAKVPDFLDGQLPRNSLICRELWQQWLSCHEPLVLRENRCLGWSCLHWLVKRLKLETEQHCITRDQILAVDSFHNFLMEGLRGKNC